MAWPRGRGKRTGEPLSPAATEEREGSGLPAIPLAPIHEAGSILACRGAKRARLARWPSPGVLQPGGTASQCPGTEAPAALPEGSPEAVQMSPVGLQQLPKKISLDFLHPPVNAEVAPRWMKDGVKTKEGWVLCKLGGPCASGRSSLLHPI